MIAAENQQSDRSRVNTLVLRAQRGDDLAMNDLIGMLTPPIWSWCLPIAKQDTADAAQESLIAVYRGLPGVQQPAALFGWARVIAVREAVRVARRSRQVPVAEFVPDAPAAEDPHLDTHLQDVMGRLSRDHRAVLQLRYLEGYDETVVAALLQIPIGTVRSRLFRARGVFRQTWV